MYVGCTDHETARAAIQRFLSEFHGISAEAMQLLAMYPGGHATLVDAHTVRVGDATYTRSSAPAIGNVAAWTTPCST